MKSGQSQYLSFFAGISPQLKGLFIGNRRKGSQRERRVSDSDLLTVLEGACGRTLENTSDVPVCFYGLLNPSGVVRQNGYYGKYMWIYLNRKSENYGII
ncbi:hypothetical protein ACR71G_22275 [Xenorhabdus bovienii]|uniref:hypothetical protein n=1 Tax=Xenorhabdus bovienii TaxID=40576 RepID=UPI0005716393